jgi:hypothetical protein
MLDPVVAAILRGALALLFLDAARHKLRDRAAFAAAFDAYRLLPEGAGRAAGAAIGGAELAVAAALLVPVADRPGALGAAGLLALYTAAIAVNLMRGRRDIDCGCAGPALRQPLGGGLVVRNLVLLGAALLCLVPTLPRSLVWLDAVTALGAVGVLACGYAAAQRLLSNAPAMARVRADA